MYLLRIFLSIVALFHVAFAGIIGPRIDKCYQRQSDFANACTQTLNGVQDGGRCFFLTDNPVSWDNGWTMCASHGVQMAQIHTEGEFNKVTNYLKALGFRPNQNMKFAWIALYDPNQRLQGMNSTCIINMNSTIWCDNKTTPNPQLIAGNTWIRYHQCTRDRWLEAPPRCFLIFNTDTIDFGDWACQNTGGTLCQANNEAQSFTRTNSCLTETPIEIATVSNPYDCSELCSNRGWCRSFNVILGSGFTCQLFTWSIYDTCPSCGQRVAANQTCVLYNYVP